MVDFKAGLDGEVAPRDQYQSALVTYERDIAGVIIGSSVNGTTSLAPLDAWDGTGPNFGGMSAYAQYVRPDGFEIAGIQINGVRAFDPALGSWTTPDAFEGDIHDPASQQKYMWNRGNPVEYYDPSGYYWESINGIPAEALYIAFQSKDFVEAWNVIAGSSVPFTLTGNDASKFNPPESAKTVGITSSERTRDSSGDLGLWRSDAYIKPGMTIEETASTIMHEVGSHQYFALKDPNRELDEKYANFRELRALGREGVMAAQANIFSTYQALHSDKTPLQPAASGKP